MLNEWCHGQVGLVYLVLGSGWTVPDKIHWMGLIWIGRTCWLDCIGSVDLDRLVRIGSDLDWSVANFGIRLD